jgi:hypothetical protein
MASGDPIDRALARNNGIARSPLEKLVRANAYKLVNGTETDDAKLDAFIREQRQDEFYSASFTAPPGPARTAAIDMKITEERRIAIATGAVVIEADKPSTASIPGTVQASEKEFAEIIASGKVRVG